MAKVIINGIEYVPKAEVGEVTDEKIQGCLESLTEIMYFSDCSHKHCSWAWQALNSLAPEIAELEPSAAYERVHGAEE